MSGAAPHARDSRTTRWAGLLLGTLVAMGALTWLFLRASLVDAERHFGYAHALLDLREADALVDSEVLATQKGLSLNYDGLTAHVKRSEMLGEKLGRPPEFLSAPDYIASRDAAAELRQALATKSSLVDLYKRKQAILKNSITYFPVAARMALDEEASLRLPDARGRLNRYVRELAVFAQNGDARHLERLRQSRLGLEQVRVGREDGALIEGLLLHGNLIERTFPEVDRLVREILGNHIRTRFEALTATYDAGYNRANLAAARYRFALFAAALLVTAYLAYLFQGLVRARDSLAVAHRELGERYAAQLESEKQLRLHATAFHAAHDGITLTDARGNILEVNPAFTRITGYTRDEVAGKNPRVLKSGRHDKAFYDAMWSQIEETGSWRGEIWNRNKLGEIYPELLSISAVRDRANSVVNYVAVFADISRLKEQESRLSHLAYFDALTELPNRVLLADRIFQGMQQAVRAGTLMAVCYLDLDGFKQVNDTWGHDVGDQLLVEMAGRLRQSVRGGDSVARLGGDEFVLLLLGLESINECALTVERLLLEIAKPLLVAGHTVSLPASIGVTTFPQENADADSLVRQADQAMYRAKQAGKNTYQMFDPEQDLTARTRNDRIARLRDALERNELMLYFQPRVDMRRGLVIGAEALIRWQHPERGVLPPSEFLPLIADHELIVSVGDWVIDSALAQMRQWRTEGINIRVSVNVAGRQLQHKDFVERVQTAIGRYAEVATQLELEVLETTALEDIAKASRVIKACGALGVRVALDDFGTGYSSLTYLKRLPADVIKIDQSFVREMLVSVDDLVIVEGVLGLARAFQREVVAEGVETTEHARLLLQLECEQAQGYGIARPMPAADLAPWIRGWRPEASWSAFRALRWDSADYPLLGAEVEHRSWISNLLVAVRDGKPPALTVFDGRTCRFCNWYNGRGMSVYGALPSLAAVESQHRELHRLAQHFGALFDAGKEEEALASVVDLLSHRDNLLRDIAALQIDIGVPR